MSPTVVLRTVLLAAAVVLAAAALLMIAAERRQSQALVLSRDIPPGHLLAAPDLEIRSAPQGAIPEGAIADPADAVGRHARGPLPRGQYLVAKNLDEGKARALAESSFEMPIGWSLVALPIDYEHALGGALDPGQRVDVYAVAKRTGAQAEILAPGARLVDVRSNDGLSLALARGPGVDADEPVGSVLVAIPRALLADVIARIQDSTFVLATAAGGSD